ncbi:hypothetical protein [Nonomuraea sp. NEAU-A123]|uniref:hypothetical protein n=1 Tax=Nonomuraea sp. NEAU-A123 TaxID=2839649 RepID=UPI001BE456A5|nr:hypothetical protein [Nonomuraea sp. NEAU-A123]MBT2225225.1 hypothetical protein [Nonomuraea sp. NEAU-A123]
MADALVAAARKVVAGVDGLAEWLAGRTQGEWDGDALKAFVKRVDKTVGGRKARLVKRLVSFAIELNELGVQVQYTKRMIKLAVMLFVVQMLWLTWALLHPAGRLTAQGLFKVRAEAARWTVRQFRQRLMVNVALFGALMGGMDLYVQATQTRRDHIDLKQLATSAGMGMMTGGLLTGLAWALPTRSLWMLMGHSGVASAGATMASSLMSGQPLDWTLMAKAFTSGMVGGVDAHWASWAPGRATGHGGDAAPLHSEAGPVPEGTEGGSARGASDDGGGPTPSPRGQEREASSRAEADGSVRGVQDGDESGAAAAGRRTDLSGVREELAADHTPRAAHTGRIDQLINRDPHADVDPPTVRLRQEDVQTSGVRQNDGGRPVDSSGPRAREAVSGRIEDAPTVRLREGGAGRGENGPGGRSPGRIEDTPTIRLRQGDGGQPADSVGPRPGEAVTGRIEDAPTVRMREGAPEPGRTVDANGTRDAGQAADAGRASDRSRTTEAGHVADASETPVAQVRQPWYAQEGFREPSRIGHWTFPGELVRGLLSGIKDRIQLSGGMVNAGHVARLVFHDGSSAVEKVLQRPGVVDIEAKHPRRRADSEELGSLVYEAVGARVPRVYRMGPDRLLIEFLHGFGLPRALGRPGDVLVIGLGDVLTLNADRWRTNFMVAEDGRTAGIDHEFCFIDPADLSMMRGLSQWARPFFDRFEVVEGPEGAQFAFKWRDNELSASDVARIEARLRELEPHFAARGRQDWYAGLMQRWEGIARHAANGPGSIIDPPPLSPSRE